MTCFIAFDTALGGCTVALSVNGRLAAARQVETARDQAKILIPLINEVLGEAGLVYADLARVVTTVGPGSFTGLRLGLSTARSLALALSIPLTGVTTLDVLARQAAQEKPSDSPILAVIETKRTDFYAQLFDPSGQAQSAPMALQATEIVTFLEGQAVTLCGDAVTRFRAETDDSLNVSREIQRVLLDPLTLVEAGAEAAVRDPAHQPLSPLYLRGADVSVSKRPQRQIVSK